MHRDPAEEGLRAAQLGQRRTCANHDVGWQTLLVWAQTAEYGQDGTLHFATFDAEGVPDSEPRALSHADRITPGRGATQLVRSGSHLGLLFDKKTIGVVETGTGCLATWAQSRFGGTGPTGGYAVLRVARLDREGRLVAAPVALHDIEDSVDDVEPSFLRFGDAIAVLWAHGTHLYGCGGCMPDHRIDMVLIDAETLDPLSNVVSIAKRTDHRGGGLVYRDAVVTGDTVLLTFDQQYHTSADPGSAAISCARR